MSQSIAQELMDRMLTRAAEQIGDLTGPAMARYYERLPEALATFEQLALGNRPLLEGQMIGNSLYCLMHWLDSPGEIEILLGESVPHHCDTLQIPTEWYEALIDTTAEVIAETIPPQANDERELLQRICSELHAVFERCRREIAARAERRSFH